MEIIFHCDDMGATINSTKRILQACEDGLINSFSILANGEGIEDISKRLKELTNGKLRIAIHLNLLEGKLLSSINKSLLADNYGNMHFSFIDLLFYWLLCSKKKRKILLNEIEQEWRAQIEMVKTICYPHQITSVDGHEHINILPFLFPLVVKLAEEQKIPQIRIPREVFHFSENLRESLSITFLVNIIKHYVLKILTWYSIDKLKLHNDNRTKYIIGILYTGIITRSSVKAGIEAAEKKRATSVEIIFHIGKAAETEMNRWEGNQKVASFNTSTDRDKEYNELVKLRREGL